jgi:cytoskeletal protein CcmA (bactofilin family)
MQNLPDARVRSTRKMTRPAGGRVIVHKTAVFDDDLSAPAVSVDEGALVQGRLEIAGRR